MSLSFSLIVAFGIFVFADELSNIIYHKSEIAKYLRILAPLIIVMYLDIIIDGILKGLDAQVDVMIVNIFDAYSRRQHLGKVKNCFVHFSDMDTNQELVRYNVDGNYAEKTGIFVADIYRNDEDEWEFKAIGEGVKVANISDMVKLKCN